MWIEVILTGLVLGAGLAMDAFSVSLANGLHEPKMKTGKILGIASTFAIFQALMPMIGWICVHTLAEKFDIVQKFVPYIALGLLGFIGGKMLYEGIKKGHEDEENKPLGFWALIIQGIGTSIDALSAGVTNSHFNLPEALVSSAIIGAITLGICTVGIIIGKKFGTGLAGKASILGGIILIVIGIWIFIKGILGINI